jgi:4-hydroxy-tetrahydrodipicolinate reductase
MRIAIIGYGKMGKEIERISILSGHEIGLITDSSFHGNLIEALQSCDVAIEFTGPETARQNVLSCIEAGIPVVCGSTGWTSSLSEIRDYCIKKNGSFFYASNFSIGVNILFAINDMLATMMNGLPEYRASIEEIHHIMKKDAPSGTAIHLATEILKNHHGLQKWKLIDSKDLQEPSKSDLPITAIRSDDVPGTHTIAYTSSVDRIEIKHTAFNREGFAKGALAAARWMIGKKGCFEMKDMLQLQQHI